MDTPSPDNPSPPSGRGRESPSPPAPGVAWADPAAGDQQQQPAWDPPPAWAAPAPPPRRRHTGLIVGLVAAGVAVLVAAAIAVVAATDTGSRPVAVTTATTPIVGPAIQGDRYAFGVPASWKDVTSEARARAGAAMPQGVTVLHVLNPEGPGPTGTGAVLQVLRQPCPCGDLDELPDQVLTGAGSRAEVSMIGAPQHAELGGEEAITFEFTGSPDRTTNLHFRMSIAVHAGSAYIVSIDSLDTAFAGYEDDYRHVVRTWQWR